MDGPTPSEERDLPVTELLKRFSTTEKGLSSSEAAKRLQQYGPNDIVEKKRSAIVAFLHYFWGPSKMFSYFLLSHRLRPSYQTLDREAGSF